MFYQKSDSRHPRSNHRTGPIPGLDATPAEVRSAATTLYANLNDIQDDESIELQVLLIRLLETSCASFLDSIAQAQKESDPPQRVVLINTDSRQDQQADAAMADRPPLDFADKAIFQDMTRVDMATLAFLAAFRTTGANPLSTGLRVLQMYRKSRQAFQKRNVFGVSLEEDLVQGLLENLYDYGEKKSTLCRSTTYDIRIESPGDKPFYFKKRGGRQFSFELIDQPSPDLVATVMNRRMVDHSVPISTEQVWEGLKGAVIRSDGTVQYIPGAYVHIFVDKARKTKYIPVLDSHTVMRLFNGLIQFILSELIQFVIPRLPIWNQRSALEREDDIRFLEDQYKRLNLTAGEKPAYLAFNQGLLSAIAPGADAALQKRLAEFGAQLRGEVNITLAQTSLPDILSYIQQKPVGSNLPADRNIDKNYMIRDLHEWVSGRDWYGIVGEAAISAPHHHWFEDKALELTMSHLKESAFGKTTAKKLAEVSYDITVGLVVEYSSQLQTIVHRYLHELQSQVNRVLPEVFGHADDLQKYKNRAIEAENEVAAMEREHGLQVLQLRNAVSEAKAELADAKQEIDQLRAQLEAERLHLQAVRRDLSDQQLLAEFNQVEQQEEIDRLRETLRTTLERADLYEGQYKQAAIELQQAAQLNANVQQQANESIQQVNAKNNELYAIALERDQARHALGQASQALMRAEGQEEKLASLLERSKKRHQQAIRQQSFEYNGHQSDLSIMARYTQLGTRLTALLTSLEVGDISANDFLEQSEDIRKDLDKMRPDVIRILRDIKSACDVTVHRDKGQQTVPFATFDGKLFQREEFRVRSIADIVNLVKKFSDLSFAVRERAEYRISQAEFRHVSPLVEEQAAIMAEEPGLGQLQDAGKRLRK